MAGKLLAGSAGGNCFAAAAVADQDHGGAAGGFVFVHARADVGVAAAEAFGLELVPRRAGHGFVECTAALEDGGQITVVIRGQRAGARAAAGAAVNGE
jgi:hypothetical protein